MSFDRLYGRGNDLTLEGITRFKGQVAYDEENDHQDVEALLGAAQTIIRITPPYTIPRGLLGACFVLSAPSSTQGVTLGQPGIPGRRFKFVLDEDLGTTNRDIDVYVASVTDATTGKIRGSVINMVSTGQAARVVQVFTDQRGTGFAGRSSPASSRPRRGDWLEFHDVGNRWIISGVSGATRTSSIQPIKSYG